MKSSLDITKILGFSLVQKKKFVNLKTNLN